MIKNTIEVRHKEAELRDSIFPSVHNKYVFSKYTYNF